MLQTEIIILVGIIGLLVGSFLNVVIYRLPMMLEAASENRKSPVNLIFPASHCMRCQQKIRWWQNIPVASFCFLQGKCTYCKAPISWQYPMVELLSGLLSAFLAWYLQGQWFLLMAAILFTWCLIALAVIDINTMLLPDELTLSLLWLGLLANSLHLFANLNDAVWGAVVGYLFLFLLNYAYKMLRKKEGMGGGDFKLLAAFGAWMGWQMLPVILFISSILGLIFLFLRLIFRKINLDKPIAFGPFLAVAGWLSLIFHVGIMNLIYSIL